MLNISTIMDTNPLESVSDRIGRLRPLTTTAPVGSDSLGQRVRRVSSVGSIEHSWAMAGIALHNHCVRIVSSSPTISSDVCLSNDSSSPLIRY